MNKRILIIDDEDDIRDVVRMSLEQTADWTTVTAASGCEGLARASAELPDAILLDVMMPDMDGATALARLKANPRTAAIPVIWLTAKVQAARQAANFQVAGVILKPFDPITLASQVAEVLGWTEPGYGAKG